MHTIDEEEETRRGRRGPGQFFNLFLSENCNNRLRGSDVLENDRKIGRLKVLELRLKSIIIGQLLNL